MNLVAADVRRQALNEENIRFLTSATTSPVLLEEWDSCNSSLRVRRNAAGFTLIEIMIVVMVIGIVATIGLPAMINSMRKEGMRKASSDLVEAFSHGRAAAIFSGNTAEVVIRPEDKKISISASNAEGATRDLSFSATLPENVRIEILGVNFIELQDEEEARVRFFPNGTSDEFAIVLRSDEGEVRKITLDIVTALADVEIVR